MASIRRTLTDRPALLPTAHRPSYAPPSSLRRLLMGRSRPYPPRKWAHYQSQQPAWNRSLLLRLSLFFLLGFLLGLSPFSGLQEGEARVGPIEPSFESPLLLPPPNQRDRGNPPRAGQQIEDSDPREPFQKLLIVVTPTYNRALQAFYLTRLANTLRLLPPPLLWIVTETGSASPETAKLLRTAGVMYRHLTCANISSNIKDRGVHQRNAALQHIELHRLDGIVYFADDDNIYSLELFKRMREIRRFGTWPVAMLAQSKNKAMLEGPVCNGSQVIGWHTNEKSKRLRRFHVDMSGFAFNSTILWDPKRWHRPTSAKIRQLDTVKEGFQETTFIEQLVEDESQMEAIPNGCSRVMNWHLHLEAKSLVYPRGWQISRNLDVVIHLQ